MVIGTYISIITLNVNGLNAPAKRHRLAEWIQKQDPYICCLQQTHFRARDTYRLKVRGWKKIFHANGNQKKAGIAILISDKIDFKTKTRGFPGGAVVENLPANAGDTGSSPGLGRSHVPRSNWAREPQLLNLRVWSLCSTTREAATVRGPRTAMKSGPHSPQLEKALAQKRRLNTVINK